jgi:hypothetical protein
MSISPFIRTLGCGRLTLTALMTALLFSPPPAAAQPSDAWEVTVAPLYLWATKIDGEVTARSTTVPVFLSFDNAVDNLAGAFSFHVEARKGSLGVFSDLNFVRLSSESTFTVPTAGAATRTIEGDFDFDNTTFEAGGSYAVMPGSALAVIGGIRTYSVSPKLEFSTAGVDITPIDVSRTSINGFAGFTYRPEISPKLRLLSRADIGGGGGLTWSAMLGAEFRPKPWAGLVIGYKAFGIDVGSDDDEPLREYDVTYYGPIFGLNFHFGAK